MSSGALSILHAFHRDLQQSTLEGVKHLQSQTTPAIAEYARRFQECLPPEYTKVRGADLINAALDSDVVLFGDFHTLPQSQNAFLELLKRIHEKDPARHVHVAMEIFTASDQDHIDDYRNGRLPEEYFLKRIDYQNKWGFPWENYKPIVDFCVLNKIPILGINCQAKSVDRLAKRDAFAAGIIHATRSADSEALVLCLIGEYHLADAHLPHALNDQRIVRVVNNIDEYSLPALSGGIQSFETLLLKPGFFCVLNTSPWLKWQSLAMWEELHGVSEERFYGGEIDAYTVQEYDFEYQLLFILKSVNDLLQLGIAATDLSFDVYLKPDRPTLSYLRTKFRLSRHEASTAEAILQKDGYYYIPGSKAILLLDFSLPHLLEAAGCILLDCLNPAIRGHEEFVQRAHYRLCGALCSLIMNPRRVIVTLDQVQEQIQLLQRKRLLGERKKHREAYRQVRSLHDGEWFRLGKGTSGFAGRDRNSGFILSRMFGEVLAHQVFATHIARLEPEFKKGLATLFTGNLLAHMELLVEARIDLRTAS